MQSKIWLKLLISSDVCHCNELGTSSGSSECLVHHFGTLTLSLCHCKEGYSGMYCHICASGYYRLGPNMPCYKCPCGPLKSNGHCHFGESIFANRTFHPPSPFFFLPEYFIQVFIWWHKLHVCMLVKVIGQFDFACILKWRQLFIWFLW